MARRSKLHEKFCEILGTRNVYFQPPESVKLVFDCIVYKPATTESIYADDDNYIVRQAYEVILIYRDPDSELPMKLQKSFNKIRHNRNYDSDNLHHDAYTIYY